ncbi:MAG: A/G-specific adenine glycosylase [Sutterellaceae bacterium]|nr:A/G-specific adenine glycosylase [Sutterellaceae bacterium]
MRELQIADPAGFHKTIVAWQKKEGRHHLPWMVHEAYLRWLSEIMLQQTQVSVVVDYFARFTQSFPTVKDLAEAPETEVMRLWAGLGYYSRARNLHRAAKMVMTDFGGAFPETLEGLMKLPGVGRSTASAIGSFCFDLEEPVLDGNVKRVLSRVTAFDTAVDSTEGDKALLALAKALVKGDEPGVFNQGMMDIGALVCTRIRPKCDACPASDICRAFLAANPEDYPKKKPKLVRSDRTLKLALVEKEGKCLLVQRTSGDIWPGLWCLPELVDAPDRAPVLRIKRVLTHLNLTIEVYRTENSETLDLESKEVFWVEKTQTSATNDLPLPTPIRLIFEKLAESRLL